MWTEVSRGRDAFLDGHAQKVVRMGRANHRSQSVFYAASNIPTALSEVEANIGDVVQITLVRVCVGRTLTREVVGEQEYRLHDGPRC